MWRRNLFAAVAALIAMSCASSPPPVALDAAPTDLARLVGEWHGEYESTGAGRYGSILFVLRSTADSAYGEVLMVPTGYSPPRTPAEASEQIRRPVPQVLTIAFVHAEGGTLSGQLAPYRDPECGCPLNTVFTGRLTAASEIRGTFVTTGPPGHAGQSGQWSVRRRQQAGYR